MVQEVDHSRREKGGLDIETTAGELRAWFQAKQATQLPPSESPAEMQLQNHGCDVKQQSKALRSCVTS